MASKYNQNINILTFKYLCLGNKKDTFSINAVKLF